MIQKRPISWSRSSGLPDESQFRRTDERERGFTLIEVLVAFAIASVFVTAIYQSFATSLNASQRAEDRMNALLVAQSKMAALGVELSIGDELSRGGPQAGFSWEIKVEPLRPDVSISGPIEPIALVNAKVSVFAEESDGSPIISLDTVRRATHR